MQMAIACPTAPAPRWSMPKPERATPRLVLTRTKHGTPQTNNVKHRVQKEVGRTKEDTVLQITVQMEQQSRTTLDIARRIIVPTEV